LKDDATKRRAAKSMKASIGSRQEIVVRQTRGVIIEDDEGKSYVDFSCGNYNVLGYCHPKIVREITEIAQRLDHVPLARGVTDLVVEHAEKLKSISPGLADGKVAYGCSGTESVEFATKLAVGHTKRPILLAYRGGHHGRGPGTIGLTADIAKSKSDYPYISNVVHIPFPYCYRCPLGHEASTCAIACFDYLKETFDTVVPPDSVAGILIEPIQGWNGYVVPPTEYMRKLDRLCRELGILLIDDEVLLNMGSTGKMLSIEHFEIEPNIIAFGKALGFGFPLSAIVARAQMIDEWPHGRNVSTAAANHLAIAASLKGMQIIEEDRLIDSAVRVGTMLRDKIRKAGEKFEFVGEVRGKGLCVGIEFVQDRSSRKPSSAHAEKLVHLAFEKGLLLGRTGTYGHVVRVSPPLITTTAIAEDAAQIISDSLDALQ